MRFFTVIIVCLLLLPNNVRSQGVFENTHNFMRTYVVDGLINYDSIRNNPAMLEELVAQTENYLLAGKSPAEQKAFYTNAYNILVIKQVIDNYPTEGPMAIDGFFDETTFEVSGSEMTLDELEKEILFPAFPDPRLHFVLVCAAVGCPPIADFAYVPDSLDVQLENKTREVLNINWYVRVYKNRTLISKVFDWYEADFVTDTSGVKDFINQYREILIPEDHTLETYDYDWSLNDSSNFRF